METVQGNVSDLTVTGSWLFKCWWLLYNALCFTIFVR